MAASTVKIKIKLGGKAAKDWSAEHKKQLAQLGLTDGKVPEGSDKEDVGR
jgi:hypothetical protein